jgi:hypothetical protein
LTVWPLLPAQRTIRTIGGRGYEFWVDHAVGVDGGKNQRGPRGFDEAGAWRIEVAPKKKAVRDCFLTVLHAGLKGKGIAAEDIRCFAEELDGRVRLRIERQSRGAWQEVATANFRTSGPVEAQCAYAGEEAAFTAPPPPKVPRARSR